MSTDTASAELTRGSRLAKNTIWNFLRQGLPLLVGLVAIPLLIGRLGIERFGILTLAWMVVGYFSLFDFGLGRALTALVAEKLGAGRQEDIPRLVWSALIMMGVLGLIGASVLAVLTPWLTSKVLRIPIDMQSETAGAFLLLAATVPVVVTATALQGVLEAYQRFDLVAAVGLPMGLWTFVGPVSATLLSDNLVLIVLSLVLGRAVAWVAYAVLCLRTVPWLGKPVFRGSAGIVKSLLSYGKWMTVTNLVSPLMVRLDRVVIGATITMSAVAYYATPYGIVTRLLLIPDSIVGVLFPALSSVVACDRDRAARLCERGTSYIFLLIFPVALTLTTFAQDGLTVWLGEEFAHQSAPVLRWLAVGVWINSLAHVPFVLIQADGRPDLTAKLHLVELPLYLVLLWWLLGAWGIEGAAIAWVVRVAADTGALYWIALRRLPQIARAVRRGIGGVVGAILALVLCLLAEGILLRLIVLVSCLFGFYALAWHVVLQPDDRNWIWRRFRLQS